MRQSYIKGNLAVCQLFWYRSLANPSLQVIYHTELVWSHSHIRKMSFQSGSIISVQVLGEIMLFVQDNAVRSAPWHMHMSIWCCVQRFSVTILWNIFYREYFQEMASYGTPNHLYPISISRYYTRIKAKIGSTCCGTYLQRPWNQNRRPTRQEQ